MKHGMKNYFLTTKNAYYIDGGGDILDNDGVVVGYKAIKYLYSYDTLIGYVIFDNEIEETHIYLTRYYDYSRTTIQHLHKFLDFLGIKGCFNVTEFRKVCEYGTGVKTLIYNSSGRGIFYHYDSFDYAMETLYFISSVNNIIAHS